MNHEINLTGYTATCGEPNNMLDLGTAGSYGLEKLHVTADAAWNGLTITATFTNSGSTTVAVSDGTVDVPPEATRLPTRDRVRYGMLAFKGVDANGKLRIISTPIYYKVQASAATDGSNTIAPTPDQYAQFVAEVTAEADRAEAAANRAESAGGNVTPEQIAEAVNDYLDKNPVQATPIDATLTQSGQAADAKAVGDAIADIELTPGPAGANGITPTIGNNGNWYLGDTDTGKPSRGGIGPSGADGKSAYQYAVDGGYTGTEEEFAAKLAAEMPDKLPNPNALTFTGAVEGSYDGSEPVTVNIPSGGSGGSGGGVSAVNGVGPDANGNVYAESNYKEMVTLVRDTLTEETAGLKRYEYDIDGLELSDILLLNILFPNSYSATININNQSGYKLTDEFPDNAKGILVGLKMMNGRYLHAASYQSNTSARVDMPLSLFFGQINGASGFQRPKVKDSITRLILTFSKELEAGTTIKIMRM